MKTWTAYLLLVFALNTNVAAAGKDPRLRDETISKTFVTVEVNALPNGIHEYLYSLKSSPDNKGSIISLGIDISCAHDFGDVIYPEPPEPLFNRVLSEDGNFAPVQPYLSEKSNPIGLGITVDNRLSMGISLEPGESASGIRILSPAPPMQRAYELWPSWPVTDEWNYDLIADISQEELDAMPWIYDFVARGTTVGPGCPGTEPEIYPGSGDEPDDLNALLTYEAPLSSKPVALSGNAVNFIIRYAANVDPTTFRVQPGWARKYFRPVAGTREEVLIPLHDGTNRIRLSAAPTDRQRLGKMSRDIDDFSLALNGGESGENTISKTAQSENPLMDFVGLTHGESWLDHDGANTVIVLYGEDIDPDSLEARLNGQDVARLFHPVAYGQEVVTLPFERDIVNKFRARLKAADAFHSTEFVTSVRFKPLEAVTTLEVEDMPPRQHVE